MCLGLAADIDHVGLAGGVEMGELGRVAHVQLMTGGVRCHPRSRYSQQHLLHPHRQVDSNAQGTHWHRRLS
jgi:hypothetical protein